MGEGSSRINKLALEVRDDKIVVVNCRDVESICMTLKRGDFLSNDHVIDKLEALYQLALGNAVYGNKTGWSGVVELLKDVSVKLSVFLVYYDLRRRGRLVRTSPYPRSNLILDKPSGKRAEILVLEAGRRVRLGDILEWTKLVVDSNHAPIVAIVDELGVITYYEVTALSSLY